MGAESEPMGKTRTPGLGGGTNTEVDGAELDTTRDSANAGPNRKERSPD